MKLKRRGLGMIMSLIMAAGLLGGCSGNDSTDTGADDKGTQHEGTAADSGTSEEELVELTVFIDHTWYDTDKFEGIIPEEITKQTGVVLKPVKAVDAMQLGVIIASDEEYDLIYTSQLGDRLSSSNICYSYNELIEQYAPSFQPSEDQIMVASSLSSDENYYTILNASSTQEEWRAASAGSPTLASLIYRRDILDELGMKPPATLDELLDVFKAVKEKYPDMVPLTMEYSFMTDFFKSNIIENWQPTTESMIEAGDKKIIHQTSSPQYEEYLKFMNTLYLEGYINADNFAYTDGTQSEELMVTNKAFAMTFMTGERDTKLTQDLNANGHEGFFEHAQPMSELSYNTPGAGWSGVYITKNNKNPEASIKLLEWMFSEEGQKLTQWGREGIDYEEDENGVPIFSDEWIEARENGTLTEIYNPNYYFGISGVIEAVGRASGISESANAAMDAIRENLIVSVIPGLITPKSDTPERIMLDQITETVKSYDTKIILSGSDEEFDKNLAELHQKLEQIGIKEIEEYYTREAAQYYDNM